MKKKNKVRHAIINTLKRGPGWMNAYSLSIKVRADALIVESVLRDLVAGGQLVWRDRQDVGWDREYLRREYTLRTH